jgi:LysM repeat protein
MPPQTNRSLTRLAAPIALVVVAIAFLFVLATSGTDGGGGGDKASETSARTSTEQAAKRKTAPRKAATYTVKTGDTLGAIAEKTGIDVEELQTLNPELDPQALVSGQKIKLRE